MIAAFDYATAAKETVACNLCGGTDTKPVATEDRYGLPVTTVRCKACGLRYQNPRLTESASDDFYASGYRPLLSAYYKRTFNAESIEGEQWTYAAQTAAILTPHVPRGGKLLDVGGSTGIVAQMFQLRFGTEGIVIDPAADELAMVRGNATIRASAESADFPKADLAMVCRAIDHFRDPKGVLTRLRAAVPLLFVDIVNVDAIPKAKRYKLDHPYSFTPTTLTAMLEASGWAVSKTWMRHAMRSVCFLCVPRKDS